MHQTDLVVDVTQVLDVVSVLVELLAGVGMHRVDDKVIVHVVAVKMKRHHNIISGPRTTGKLQAHLYYFFRIDIFVGVEGLHVVPKAQTVCLLPYGFIRHELLIRHFGIAAQSRHAPSLVG